MYQPVLYHIIAFAVYACILTICILALIFGLRARAKVKKEKVTALSRGFSPLDVQRIFIGKTYPRKLTRALIVHWAQMGYIRVKYVSKNHVHLICIKKPPVHNGEDAVFFDRGTYVRERDLFNKLFAKENSVIPVNLNKPLFDRKEVKSVNEDYATREDEGVYSSAHYKLKVFTFILSFAPFVLCAVYMCVTHSVLALIAPFIMMLGMFVFRFMREIPLWFRILWSTLPMAASIAIIICFFNGIFDPLRLAYTSAVFLFIGSFILVQFVDYREKNNLADYSDLINFKKFLLFSPREKLQDVDYYEVLPFLYAFNIKLFVKRKFNTQELPPWFISQDGKRGSLL